MNGVWNEAGVAFRFTLRRTFTNLLVYGLVGVALFGLTYLAYRRRLFCLAPRSAPRRQEFSRQLIASQEGERQRIAGSCTMAWGNG